VRLPLAEGGTIEAAAAAAAAAAAVVAAAVAATAGDGEGRGESVSLAHLRQCIQRRMYRQRRSGTA
jgi:hypothetical protein